MAGLFHGREGEAGGSDDAHEVEFEGAVPLVVGEGFKRRERRAAGVVDEDIDRARGLEEDIELGGVGDVGGDGGDGRSGLSSDFGGGLFEVGLSARRYGDASSFASKGEGGGFAKSFAGGEDKGVFVGEAEVHDLIVEYALASLDSVGVVPGAGLLLLRDDAALGGLG